MDTKGKIYDYYYTASDVYISFFFNNKLIRIDKAIGIAYRHSVSSIPVYALGRIDPAFFSKGNSLVQGQLDLAFKSNAYMKTAINYLLDVDSEVTEGEQLKQKLINQNKNKSNPKLTSEEYTKLQNYLTSPLVNMEKKSISDINYLIDIHITFNNSNSSTETKSKEIKIYGVKFTEQAITAMSHDEGILVDRYTFMAKNIE